jgi:uncharacterized cupredoxin-like copper-binding protein
VTSWKHRDHGGRIGGSRDAADRIVRRRDGDRARFVNNGSQAHEFVVMRLNDGKTLGDALPYLQAGFQGDKPLTFEGGSGGVEPGHTGFVDLSLTPGQYVAMCFITDPASHRHHAELGMVAPFSVTTP